MLRIIHDLILVNAYWFSLPLIGYGLLLFLKQWSRAHVTLRHLSSFALKQHFFTVFFFSFAFIVAILGAFSALFYLFHLPAVLFAAIYVMLLLWSGSYMGYLLFKNIRSTAPIDIFGLRHQPLFVKLIFGLLCAVIVGDFAIALYVKSYALLSVDTYVHLSRIVTILNQGFTVESGFFHGLPETGYHMNVIYALYVVPCELFRMNPDRVWEFSYGFFRFIQWAALFTLSWHVSVYWLKSKFNTLLLTSITTIFAIAYFSATFFIAPYPNQVVNVWLILFVMALSFYELRPKRTMLPIFGAAFLIVSTHPTYALMTALFMGLLFVCKTVIYRKEFWQDRRNIKLYVTTITILMLGPIRTVLFPNRISQTAQNIGNIQTWGSGILTIKDPLYALSSPTKVALSLLGSLGFMFLVYKLWKMQRYWVTVVALIIFFPVMLYEPIAYSLLHGILPLWLMDRFAAMNVLSYISIPLGLYACIVILSSINKKWHFIPATLNRPNVGFLLWAIAMFAISLNFMVPTHKTLLPSRIDNEHYYSFMDRTHDDFDSVLNNKQLVVANAGNSYLLAAVLPVDVIAIEEGHTTPAADAPDRISCQKQLLRYFDYADLASVHADFVAIATYDEDYKMQKIVVDSRPYLKRVAQNQEFLIYRFDKSKAKTTSKPFNACLEFQRVEKS